MEKTGTWSKPEVYIDGDKKYEVSYRYDRELGFKFKKVIRFDPDGIGVEVFYSYFNPQEVEECSVKLPFGLV